jgi:hypothetical protein
LNIFAIKKLKRLILIDIVIFFACFTFAHSPGRIVLKPDLANKTLNVTVHHRIKSSEVHFISRAEIYLNGQKVEDLRFSEQSSFKEHVFSEKLDEMKAGDKIEVVCYCNRYGQNKSSVIVKNEQTKKT